MLTRLTKLALLTIVMVLIAMVFGGFGITSTYANAPQSAPPTVALPTRSATKAPPTPVPANPQVRQSNSKTGARGAFTSYTSSINMQNLSGSTASLSFSYYNSDGTSGGSYSDTISANGSKAYFPIPGANSGFSGSAIISSDQSVGSIVNIVGGNFAALDSYVGQTSGNATVSLPLLMKGNSGLNTWFNVQNAGSSDATVNVAYSDGTTAGPTTIKAGASATFNQASETHSSTVFSASVSNTTTNQPLVVSVLEESSATMSAFVGFAGGSTLPVMPLVNVQPAIGIITGITIQNVGSSSTNVTVSYAPAPGSGNGSACTETQTIPNGQNKVFGLFAFASGANSTCTAGSRFVGSGQVTANSASQALAVIVNQAKPGTNDGAYSGFNPANATNKVVMPLIMDRNNGIYTSISLMNVGSASTTATCSFTGTSYTAGTPTTLAAGASFTVLQADQIASGYVGAGTCTATNATDKIVAIVNQLGPGAGDQLLVYNAINQ